MSILKALENIDKRIEILNIVFKIVNKFKLPGRNLSSFEVLPNSAKRISKEK